MLQVELNHILPEADGIQKISEIIDHVEHEKEVYVLTKDGRPVVAIVSVDMLAGDLKKEEAAVDPLPMMGSMAPTGSVAAPAPAAPAMEFQAAPEPAPEAAPAEQPLPEMPTFVTPAEPAMPAAPTLPEIPAAPATAPAAPSGSPMDEPLDEPAAQSLPPLTGTEQLSSQPSTSAAPVQPAAQAPAQEPGAGLRFPTPPSFSMPADDATSGSPIA